MNKKILPMTISLLIILFLIGFQLTLDNPLYAPDGQNHLEFISGDTCNIGYPNALCLATNWLNLTPIQLWIAMFGISLLIPILFVIYTKNPWLFPAFFVFTGFYWQTMAMQVFAQIIMTLFLVFFIFEEKRLHRLIVLNLLLILLFFGIEFHNTELFILIAFFVYEILSLNKLVLNKAKFLGCRIFPSSIVTKVSSSAASIRNPMSKNTGSLIQNTVYYLYVFLFENMFIGFVIPAIYQIFKQKDYKKIYYFLFIVIGAFWLWFSINFEIWWVTRVLLWLPIVLIVPFYKWLGQQEDFTKYLFWFAGIIYLTFNIYYFINRVQDMGCI